MRISLRPLEGTREGARSDGGVRHYAARNAVGEGKAAVFKYYKKC